MEASTSPRVRAAALAPAARVALSGWICRMTGAGRVARAARVAGLAWPSLPRGGSGRLVGSLVHRAPVARLIPLFLVAALALFAAACESARASTRPLDVVGDAQRGKGRFDDYGCTSCHIIPGVADAGGTVGPPLVAWQRRTYIAGMLPNTPRYLVRWIMTPQLVVPGNAMPDMGVSQKDASDMAAYLYTIK